MLQRIEDLTLSVDALEEKVEEMEADRELAEEETSDMISEIFSALMEFNAKIDAIVELSIHAQVFDLDVFVSTSQEKLAMLHKNLIEKSGSY